jgi:hypothetical protein
MIAVRAGSHGKHYRVLLHAFRRPMDMRNIHAVQSVFDAGAMTLNQSLPNGSFQDREWCCTTSIQAARLWDSLAEEFTELNRK